MTAETTQRTSRAKAAIRRFIPSFVLKERSIVQLLGPKAGPMYARLRLFDALGIRASNRTVALQSACSVVFVCHGNIMRSAMAEFLMRQALCEAGAADRFEIASAGLHATPGREAHPWAQEASAELGISLAAHRAKLLSPEMVERADCVFAMDFQNKAELLTLYPMFRDKIHMLSAYGEASWQYREISDPYHGDLETTRICGRQLRTCVRNLIRSLCPDSLLGSERSATSAPRQKKSDSDFRQPDQASTVGADSHSKLVDLIRNAVQRGSGSGNWVSIC